MSLARLAVPKADNDSPSEISKQTANNRNEQQTLSFYVLVSRNLSPKLKFIFLGMGG